MSFNNHVSYDNNTLWTLIFRKTDSYHVFENISNETMQHVIEIIRRSQFQGLTQTEVLYVNQNGHVFRNQDIDESTRDSIFYYLRQREQSEHLTYQEFATAHYRPRSNRR